MCLFLSVVVNLFNFFFATNLNNLDLFKMKVIDKLKFPKESLKIINPTPHYENCNESHFISLIHSSKTILQLQQIHGQIIRKNFSSNSRIVTQLISSASLHKSINYGLSIFSCFLDKNVFLFNVLIRGLKENSLFEKSILYFRKMVNMGVRPDKLTYPFVLKSVTALGEKGVGGGVHCGILKMGLEYDTFVRVCLVELYVKVELVDFALQLFDESSERNKVESVILWNVVINGCCKIGRVSKALALFEEMPERNVGSWNTLISGLLRNGEVDKAMELFDEMTNEKNVVSWTCMIHGLMLNGLHQKALDLFLKMVEEGVKPNGLTVVSTLSACAKTGALEAGKKIHDNIVNNGLHLNAAVGNALLDMYAKCGYIDSASLVFSGLKEKDIRTWSIMIWGWAIHGHVDKALRCFEQMRLTGIKPDGVSVLAVLTGCSHAGRVNQGLQIFDSMQRQFSIEPTMKHYAAVVDLLGRAGRFDEALKFIASMPLEPDYVIWGALFSACRAHKNIEMAKVASEKLLQLEPKHAGGYVFLSNVYAGAGRWDDVERVRSSMKNKNVEKDPGWSSMEVDGQLHTFVAGDSAHTRKQEIYLKLEEIITGAKQQGYMPETEWVLHNIDEEEKEGALGSHSEKLALAFGLISTGPGVIIMIVKNLRVCGDCHSLMKYVSRMSQRVIVLRDIKRFHHFKDGVCSCKDYW